MQNDPILIEAANRVMMMKTDLDRSERLISVLRDMGRDVSTLENNYRASVKQYKLQYEALKSRGYQVE